MPWMSLSDNVAYALPFRRPAAQIEKQVVHALDLVGLAGFGKAWPNQLSGGMAQRASLARALVTTPEILLLDEGIGAVDADFLKKAQTRLQSLVERSGILVFASHSNEFLARLCKTAMWIDHGTIKMEGGIEEVVRAYEGEDAARHVREVLEENARNRSA